MKTWRTDKVSVITLGQLEVICKEISGVCHRYSVKKATPNRVLVEYSNPDEYGNEHPMVAVFPAYKNSFDKQNPNVVMEIIDVFHDNWFGEGHQAFQIVLDLLRF